MKASKPVAGLGSAIRAELDDIHQVMFAKASAARDSKVVQVTSWSDFVPALNDDCLVLTPWCSPKNQEAEDQVKERSREESLALLGLEAEDERTATSLAAKTLCVPHDQPPLPAGTMLLYRRRRRRAGASGGALGDTGRLVFTFWLVAPVAPAAATPSRWWWRRRFGGRRPRPSAAAPCPRRSVFSGPLPAARRRSAPRARACAGWTACPRRRRPGTGVACAWSRSSAWKRADGATAPRPAAAAGPSCTAGPATCSLTRHKPVFIRRRRRLRPLEDGAASSPGTRATSEEPRKQRSDGGAPVVGVLFQNEGLLGAGRPPRTDRRTRPERIAYATATAAVDTARQVHTPSECAGGGAVAGRRVPDPQIAVAAAGHEPRPREELDAGDEVRVAQAEALDLLAAGELGDPHLLVAVGGRHESTVCVCNTRQDARRVREEPPRRLVQRRERERIQLAGAARQQDLAVAEWRDT